MMNLDGFLKPRLRGKSNKLVRWPDRWFDCPTFVLKLNQVQFEAFSDFTDYNLVSDKNISKINSRIKTKFKLKMDLRISRNKKWNFEKLSFESWVDSLFLVNRECCWTRKLRACHCLARFCGRVPPLLFLVLLNLEKPVEFRLFTRFSLGNFNQIFKHIRKNQTE